MNAQMILGNNLKKKREQQSLTQERLAEKSGISVGVIRKIESGNGNPNLGTIESLSTALNTTVAEILSHVQPDTKIEIKTYADLFIVLGQLSDLLLDGGRFVNGKQSGMGEVIIRPTENAFESPESDDWIEDFIVHVDFHDRHLYKYVKSLEKMNEMIHLAEDNDTRKTLKSMRNAWVQRQMEENMENFITVDLPDDDEDVPF